MSITIVMADGITANTGSKDGTGMEAGIGTLNGKGDIKMPYYHCDCSHEFESCDEVPECDWCKSTDLEMLEEHTPMEWMLKGMKTTHIPKPKAPWYVPSRWFTKGNK